MGTFTVSHFNSSSPFTTIMDAIQMAEPGSRIVIEPGIYRESIMFDKNIELVGNGTPDQIIIESTETSCLSANATAGKISNITFRGIGDQNHYAVWIEHGETLFQNCIFSSPKTGGYVSCEGAAPTFDHCSFVDSQLGMAVMKLATPIFTGCTFNQNDRHMMVEDGAVCIVHECVISNGKIGLEISNHCHVTVLDSIIEDNENHNIIAKDCILEMRNCQVKDSKTGLLVHRVSSSRIENSCFSHHSVSGITLEKQNDTVLKNCQIIDASCGVCFQKQATGVLQDCEIQSSSVTGIAILEESSPIIVNCLVEKGENVGLYIHQGNGEVSNSQFIHHAYMDVFVVDENKTTFENCLFDKTNMADDYQDEEEVFTHTTSSKEKPTIQSLLNELHSYIGLEDVKERIEEVIHFIQYMTERKQAGLPTRSDIRHHSIFLGKPGTGKTTIARLLSKIYFKLGLIKKDICVEVDRKDLVGEVIGATARQTNKILKSAAGGVLFIDEAYTLVKPETPNDYGKEALEIILKRMEDDPSFIVIAAGYPEEMESFIEVNPGLKDRFKNHFEFEDYTPEQLIQILEKMLRTEEYRLSPYAGDLIQKEFTMLYRKRDRTFGNARMVRKFFEDMKMVHAKRCSKLSPSERTREALTTILSEDIEPLLKKSKSVQRASIPINEERLTELLDELNSYIGLESVKREITEMVKLVKYYQEEGKGYTGRFAPHTVFLGNPGTGKTTVARLLSQIYEALGILSVGNLVEASREDLVGGYIGQTEIKTKEILNKAIGNTLFIDEAYALAKKDSPNDYGQVAIEMILKRMEDQRGQFSLIVAGYSEEMNAFLKSNPGLHDRFGQFILFEDYTATEMVQIANKIVSEKEFTMGEEVQERLLHYFEECYQKRDRYFSNARFVRNIIETTIRKATLRIAETPKQNRNHQNTITIADLPLPH